MAINGRKLAKHKSCQFFKSPVFICTQLNLETYTCRFSGVAAFNFYAVSIFQASFGGGLLNPHLAAVITGTVQLLASALSGLLSDLIGRLPLLLLTSLLMSAALGGFGFYSFYRESITVWLPGGTHSDWIPLLCVLTFVAAFSMGPSPISWLLVGEMYSLGKEVSSEAVWKVTFSPSLAIMRRICNVRFATTHTTAFSGWF